MNDTDGPIAEFRRLINDGAKRLGRTTRRTNDPHVVWGRIETIIWDLEDQFGAAAETQSVLRGEAEALIGKRHHEAFAALDVTLGVVTAVLQTIGERDHRPTDAVRDAVLNLLSRTVSLGHEILALLRCGFPAGARSRWRTLSEIRVISEVIQIGGNGTAQRYKEHALYLYARDHQRVNGEDGWDGPGRSPETCIRQLTRRFGRNFATPYGWAATLTKRRHGLKRAPNWGDVQRLVDVTEHTERVLFAHHSVHGDSLGNAQLAVSDGLIHWGARVDGLAQHSADAIYLIRQAVNALLALWLTHIEDEFVTNLAMLTEELCLVEHRHAAYASLKDDFGRQSS